jgi:hypothetical protein
MRPTDRTSRLVSAAASVNAALVQVGNVTVRRINGYNAAVAPRYLKLYDKATLPDQNDVPRKTYYLPASAAFAHDQAARRNGRSTRAIYYSHGILAFRILASGMTSGLSSPSRPWFRLATYDEQQMDDADTRIYLSDVERIMYGFLAETNFYAAAKAGYAELGMFGTEACVMVGHPAPSATRSRSANTGSHWATMERRTRSTARPT